MITSALDVFGGFELVVAALVGAQWTLYEKRKSREALAKQEAQLVSLKADIDLVQHKGITRHNDMLDAFRKVIDLISVVLSELEKAYLEEGAIHPEAKAIISVTRFKAYGYIGLVSNKVVFNSYNELIDLLLPIVYPESNSKSDAERDSKVKAALETNWDTIRYKVDVMVNAMRKELGVEGDLFYSGER